MNLSEYEQMQPNVNIDGLIFLTPTQHCAWRANSLYTKEPDTIAWIRSMQPNELFFDIGANIGQYSMFAAKQGLRVHAFEPESQNFALLCRNIAINKLTDAVKAWPLAISDEPSYDYLHVVAVMPGGSCNTYSKSVNYHLQPKEFAFAQGSVATTLDDFTDRYGIPDHIKIDVDGFEHKVIAGAGGVLPLVKSVLIEINTALPDHMHLYETMADLGFEPDTATADTARRTEGSFAGIGNVIFYRKKAA